MAADVTADQGGGDYRPGDKQGQGPAGVLREHGKYHMVPGKGRVLVDRAQPGHTHDERRGIGHGTTHGGLEQQLLEGCGNRTGTDPQQARRTTGHQTHQGRPGGMGTGGNQIRGVRMAKPVAKIELVGIVACDINEETTEGPSQEITPLLREKGEIAPRHSQEDRHDPRRNHPTQCPGFQDISPAVGHK